MIATAIPPERYERSGPQPAEALARVIAMRKPLGITRIADITGLDRVGIPVVQVVRPFSLSNAVSQGKGGTLAEAAISAILESAEGYFAERLPHYNAVTASANSLGIQPNHFAAHLQDGAASDWRDQVLTWLVAENLLNGSRDMVPLELVHTAYTFPPQPHDGTFAASTTGLAAAFVESDAILHGILECVERDAIARANRTHGFFQRCRVDLETIDDKSVCELLGGLRDRGLLVGLWEAPSPTGMPVVCCHLMEDGAAETALLPHPAVGSAASLDPAAAVSHAVYEAAQSRLAAISGARDDMTRAFYPKYPDWQKIATHRRLIVEGRGSLNFHTLGKRMDTSAGGRLPDILRMLGQSGITVVSMVRLENTPLTELSVVRIIIPDLLPLVES
jgi:ribosomal protein S12 methylthiotransferase accessory factor